MLKIISYTDRIEIDSYFKLVDFSQDSWLLSDLRSKIELQGHLLQKYGYILDDYILRASDLWRTLFRKSFPEYEVISNQAALLLIQDFLLQQNEKVEFLGLSAPLLLAQVNRWSQVVFSEELSSQMKEYLQQQDTLSEQLKKEYLLSRLLAQIFLSHKKIMASWIPNLLLQKDQIYKLWQRNLWIDLRSEITMPEVEFLARLSNHCNVTIFCPDSDFESQYRNIYKPYEFIKNKNINKPATNRIKNQQIISPIAPIKGQLSSIKAHGPLSEIKWATQQIRQWLESGIEPSSISIISPDIESYWPALHEYLKYEGIPTQKPVNIRLATLPIVRSWVSTLSSLIDHKQYYDLEKFYYSKSEKILSRLEDFRSKLYEIFSQYDIQRVPDLSKKLEIQVDLKNPISRDDFFKLCVQAWTNLSSQETEDTKQYLIQILEKFLIESSNTFKVTAIDWLAFLRQITNQIEITYEEKTTNGIQVHSLLTGGSLISSHAVFLGISEENLTSTDKFGLSPTETMLIEKDLGITLESNEKRQKEYELKWWLNTKGKNIIVLEPITNWQGELYNPSSFLLQNSNINRIEITFHDYKSRWDQTQKKNPNDFLTEEIRVGISNEKNIHQQFVKNHEILQRPLSAASIQNYLRCPFLFFAGKGFRLLDLDELGLDINPLNQGQFYHAMAEAALKQDSLDLSEEQILHIIEECRDKHLQIRQSDATWTPRKSKYKIWLERFLAFEKQWRKKYPQMQIWALEKELRTTQKILHEEISFIAKIDRIEEIDNHWLIIDYKSNAQRLADSRSWLENNEIQMLFYVWIIKKMQIFSEQNQFLGAFYFDFKNMHRKYGLQIQETESTIEPQKISQLWSSNELETTLIQLEERIAETYNKIKNGIFPAAPSDLKNCDNCQWKKICRARHLN